MKEYTLFVGGYTRPFFGKEGGEGIYVFGMNPETGALTLRSTNHQAENPTFLQQRGSLLYSVGELDESEISAFRISEDKTQVTLINNRIKSWCRHCWLRFRGTYEAFARTKGNP